MLSPYIYGSYMKVLKHSVVEEEVVIKMSMENESPKSSLPILNLSGPLCLQFALGSFKNNGNGNKDYNHASMNSNNNNNSSNVSPSLDHTRIQPVRPNQCRLPAPASQPHQYHPPAPSQPLVSDHNSSAVSPSMPKFVRPPSQFRAPPPPLPRPPIYGNNNNNSGGNNQQPFRPHHFPNPVYHHPTANIHPRNYVPSAEENDEDTDDEYDSEADDTDDGYDFETEDSETEDSDDEKSYYKSKKHVHVNLQQLNGRNVMTVVAGIKIKKFDYNRILEDLMQLCCCNGCIVMDPSFGMVIQLLGDQRRNVRLFLVQEGIVKKKKHVKIHDQ